MTPARPPRGRLVPWDSARTWSTRAAASWPASPGGLAEALRHARTDDLRAERQRGLDSIEQQLAVAVRLTGELDGLRAGLPRRRRCPVGYSTARDTPTVAWDDDENARVP